ncbi:MAG: hypothetical protein QM791_14885 [Ferruginibacter sp.]
MKKLLPLLFTLIGLQAFSQDYYIAGRLYYDDNRNRVYEPGEQSLGEQAVVIAPADQPGFPEFFSDFKYADENGFFLFPDLPAGTYKVALLADYDSVHYYDDLIKYITIPKDDGGNTWSVDFAFQPKPGFGFSPVGVTHGRVYYDNNRNNIFDSGDAPYPYALLRTFASGAQNIISNYLITTDENGLYTNYVDIGSTQVNLESEYNTDEYEYVPSADKNYFSDTMEVIDFAIHKKDSIEYTFIYFDPADEFPEQVYTGGDTKHYALHFGYYGLVSSMPAKVKLDFSPKVTLASSSVAPTVSSPGHLEWNFADVRNYLENGQVTDSISLDFNIPVTGDTILGFNFQPAFIPGIPVSRVGFENVQGVQVNFLFPETPAAGPTEGIKWLRTYNNGKEFSDSYLMGIDTVKTNDGYFVLSTKSETDSFGQSLLYPVISRLDKDGLSVWEKKLEGSAGSLYNGLVKQTGDGGFIALINSYEYMTEYSGFSVMKFDSLGNEQWNKRVEGSGDEFANALSTTADGGFVIAGSSTSDDGVFANSISDSLSDNLFVMKLGSTGDITWTKVLGGSRDDAANAVLPLSNGSLLVLGYTSSLDGNVNGAHNHELIEERNVDKYYAPEAWVLNLDANGNMIWNRCYGGTRTSYFSGAIENAGGILLAGSTNSKDGDLPAYPEGATALWLLQVSNTGNIQSSRLHKMFRGYSDSPYEIPGTSIYDNHFATRLQKTKDGNFIAGGVITDKYGSIKTKHGSTDFVIVKFNPAGDILWQKAIGGKKYDAINDLIVDKNDDIIFWGNTDSENDDIYGYGYGDVFRGVLCKVGITNVIKGQVFIDNNNNGIKDASERFYSEGRISSAKIKDTVNGYIFEGQFLNNVDTGNYITTYRPPNNYYTISPVSHNTVFTIPDQVDVVNFALKPKPNMNDLEVQLIPLTIARPGFESHYRIIVKNVGTTTLSNAVTGFRKDSRQTYVSSSRPPSGATGDSIWWGPVTLNAFDIDTVDVILTNAAPPQLNNGDTLKLKVTANPVMNDSSAANNVMELKELVRGSYDPNDKTEIHGGQLTPTAYSNNESLQYLIRFQNTGTDTAFFITVKDTFDTRVDLSTIDVLAASHAYTFRLDKNVVTFDFKFIKLVDSTTDEPGSHGYIMFRVKPKRGLSVGDVFSNKAAIYFDYNLPVITNTERTFITDGSSICPGGSAKYTSSVNGVSYQWQVNTGNGYTNISNGGVYSGVNTASLQLTGAPTSMYGYKYRCLVNGSTYSTESQVKFNVKWTGAVSTDWQNAANWNCGVVPDANTDVYLQAGITNQPVINNNVLCHSIRATAGISLLVKTNIKLTVTGK